MIIYGIKQIDLNTIHLPIACSGCGHDHQWLQIYRNFFSLYFIPFIPLRKSGIISCPSCSRQLKKKFFLKEMAAKGLDSIEAKLHLSSIFKATKTPLHTFLAPLLLAITLIIFFAFSYHRDQLEKELAKQYLQNPVGNVLVVVKSMENSAYPYEVSYIAKVNRETSVAFDWKYAYETISGAGEGIVSAYKSISQNKLKEDFFEPYLIYTESLKASDIMRVRPLTTEVDWAPFAPPALHSKLNDSPTLLHKQLLIDFSSLPQ